MQKETVVTKPLSNIISLKELADDTWLWKKSQKDYTTKALKKCITKKIKMKKMLAEEKVTQFQFLLIYELTYMKKSLL